MPNSRFFVSAISILVIASGPVWNFQALKPGPKQVVEQFCAMAKEGSLLTADGWARASELFVRPNATMPSTIQIFKDGFGVEEHSCSADDAEVLVWDEEAGHIDSSRRYMKPRNRRKLPHGPGDQQ